MPRQEEALASVSYASILFFVPDLFQTPCFPSSQDPAHQWPKLDIRVSQKTMGKKVIILLVEFQGEL